MKKLIPILIMALLPFGVTACGSTEASEVAPAAAPAVMADSLEQSGTEGGTLKSVEEGDQEESSDMIMKIGETPVQVVWEENESVEALKALASDAPLTVQMSMYGGYEQVGSIGQNLPRDDKQTTTKSGDIVLYSGNQMVVFYGSNSWAYTRLGHITDKNEKELKSLLGDRDITITIENERN